MIEGWIGLDAPGKNLRRLKPSATYSVNTWVPSMDAATGKAKLNKDGTPVITGYSSGPFRAALIDRIPAKKKATKK